MKLSTIAITVGLSVLSTATLANNVVFKALDRNLATQTCLVAATQGLAAAKSEVIKNGKSYSQFVRSLTCNGLPLKAFAAKYKQTEVVSEQADSNKVKVTLVAKNQNKASQLCLDAVFKGESAARTQHGMFENVICNGKDLSDFVASFQNQVVDLAVSED